MKSRRCIFPIDGYYEWQTDSATKAKTPFYVHADEPIGLAGLYSWWRAPEAVGDEGWVFTATILTQSAAPELAWLHERMPVNVAPGLRDAWFDPNIDGNELTGPLAARSDELAGTVQWHEVAPVRGDEAQLIEGL